ncbi:SapC family protein [Sulfurospirillum multivorans]|uniref:SapC-like S-layer protein n=2 Tax=Sulfurospirillum multivorans TaxID=66821 RepID=A0AA86DYN3_SULMK|nr:SapC family protein [Sulfurospirillum multivorans]AHJ13463.1 SapC-like S-layer protein [Sulfurospirillum multivorans DSM 12446]QEH06953.1 SapC-like S-layer protein [Sulfurospirillum multivorans]
MALHIINQPQDQTKAVNDALGYPNLETMISVPLGIGEFYEACKDYPILFTKNKEGDWLAIALLGFNDKNVYLDETRRFKKGKYLPAFLRRYPFILVQNEGKEGFSLGIEEEALEALNASNQPRALFKEDKTPSDLTKNTLDFLIRFQGELQACSAFVKELEAWELLVEKSATVLDEEGKTHTINGFFTLNEEKLNHLSEKKKLDICKKGATPFMTAHLISLSNIRRLGL